MGSAQGNRQAEALAIYRWWKVERPADKAKYRQLMDELYGNGRRKISFVPVEGIPRLSEMKFPPLDETDDAKQKALWALEAKIDADDQAYLHRLIDIRPSLWT